MVEQLLFVYGTLMRETGSAMHRLLAGNADFVGKATFRGRLYLVDGYPGAVPSDDPDERVWGEVYRLRDPARVLEQLDRYEEYGPGFPYPYEFVREIGEVRLFEGVTVTAWIYHYNRPTVDLRRIPSGKFPEMPE